MNFWLRITTVLLTLVLLLPLPRAGAQGEAAGSSETDVAVERSAEASDAKNLYKNLELFASVIEIVRKHYVKEMLPQELIYGALHGLLSSLDPYSQFMEPEDYGEMKVETRGEFGGLGIEITVRDGILTIVTPIEDTPASRAGLQPGDRIVKIDNETTKNITVQQAVKKLRGKPGTTVQLTIMRPGEKALLEVPLTRDIIQIESVKEARMLDDDIGYLRLFQFQENTVEEFDRALKKLEDQDPKALILDLRYNPGGLLSTAIEVADRFLPSGQVIVQTVGRGDEVEMEVRATSREKFPDVPMVVLVNEGSASGSEIVAGALRDNHRALLVGTKTFGKGSVQSVLPLRDKSAIRLTTGYYHTASKRRIHEEGIKPDIEVGMSLAEKKNFLMKKYQALEEIEKKTREKVEGAAPTPVPTPEITPTPLRETEKEGREETEEIEGIEEPKEPAEEGEGKETTEQFDPQLRKAVDVLKGIILFREFQDGAQAES